MPHIKTELSPEIMADEILSIFKLFNIKQNESLDAGQLLMSFRSNYDGIQSGMDWLIKKGFVDYVENKDGIFRLTALGYMNTII